MYNKWFSIEVRFLRSKMLNKIQTKQHPRGNLIVLKHIQIKALPWYITILKWHGNIPNESFTRNSSNLLKNCGAQFKQVLGISHLTSALSCYEHHCNLTSWNTAHDVMNSSQYRGRVLREFGSLMKKPKN